MRWVFISLLFLLFGCSEPKAPPIDPGETVSREENAPGEANILAQAPPASNSFETWKEFDDPGSDGWETEAFSETASSLLKKMGDK